MNARPVKYYFFRIFFDAFDQNPDSDDQFKGDIGDVKDKWNSVAKYLGYGSDQHRESCDQTQRDRRRGTTPDL